MVKVIKYGKKRRVICNYCDSCLEYTKEDIRSKQTHVNEWSYEIKCPVCEELIEVDN